MDLGVTVVLVDDTELGIEQKCRIAEPAVGEAYIVRGGRIRGTSRLWSSRCRRLLFPRASW